MLQTRNHLRTAPRRMGTHHRPTKKTGNPKHYGRRHDPRFRYGLHRLPHARSRLLSNNIRSVPGTRLNPFLICVATNKCGGLPRHNPTLLRTTKMNPADEYHYNPRTDEHKRPIWNRQTGEWELVEPIDDLASAPGDGFWRRIINRYTTE